MIDPSECFVGPISAAKALTLVLPKSDGGRHWLLVVIEGKPIAICLDEIQPNLGRFYAFPCEDNTYWHGLHLPGVRIELDESSINEAEGYLHSRGSMVRVEDKLVLNVLLEDSHHSRHASLPILANLPACAPHQSARFLKWQIVLGERESKRVLWEVDAASIRG